MRRAVATSAFHALLRSPVRPNAATAAAAALICRPLLAVGSSVSFSTSASNKSRSKPREDAKKGIKIAFFSAHQYDIDSMTSIAQKEGIANDHELLYVPAAFCLCVACLICAN